MDEFSVALQERDYLDKKSGKSTATARKPAYSSRGFKHPDLPAATKSPGPKAQPVQISRRELPKTITQSIDGAPILSKDELNKLNAQLLKAKIMKLPSVKELERKYHSELERFESSQADVVILCESKEKDKDAKSIRQMKRETHDKHGNRIKYTDEVDLSLDEMVRHEKVTSKDSYDKSSSKRKSSSSQNEYATSILV